MDDVRVRAYESGDEAAVRRISERLTIGVAPWREPSRVEATIRGWIDHAIAAVESDGHVVLVAHADDGVVVGFIVVTAQDHYISGRDAYIGELAVDDDMEGLGVGRALVAEAAAWAQAQGCERLTLQTGAANTRARGFYERLGFEYEDVSMARPIEAG